MRYLIVSLLVVVFWSGSALARSPRVCACGGEPGRVGYSSRDAHVFVKTVTDTQLSVQQLRNAVLQEEALLAQIRAARMAEKKDRIIIWGTTVAGVAAVGKIVFDGVTEHCEMVESEGRRYWVCAW